MHRCVSVLVVVAGASGLALATDWPQFLGPNRDGISRETGMARSWPAGGPKVLWTVKTSQGYGGASVADGKVYFLDRIGQQKDVLRVVDFATGQEHEDWAFSYDAPGQLDHPGARAMPTMDEKFAYIVGPLGHFHCVDRATHQAVWKVHLLDDFGGKRPNWGVSQSPLLVKDLVILAPQSPTVGLIAYEKATGKEKWRSKPFGAMSYCSPVLTTLEGAEQVLMLSMDRTVGIDPADGTMLWNFPGWKCRNAIPSPVPVGDGRIFLTGGYQAGSAMIKVARKEGKWQVEQLFAHKDLGSQIHNPLLLQDRLYANSNDTKGGLVCMDLEGNIKWKTGPDLQFDIGNLMAAGDGLIYVMDGNNGTLRLVQADAQEYKELAKAQVLSGKEIWAPMTLCDGRLIVRDQKQMKCLEVRAAGGAPATVPVEQE